MTLPYLQWRAFLLGSVLTVSQAIAAPLEYALTAIYPPPASQAYSIAGLAINDLGVVAG